ncbi:uncharacterized protein EV420DRAFT_1641469 [Desarmillaria tabescens]|uniref:Bacterial alpha-L-rhamnosidase N-terminal domain-containing protein n=1 Tax=Armillaria tabescens TaxID=1929756 RepID=A0AA39KFB7_ARMTA|nr:uncharacterized protein EV420DRAFT_1641469 [Desarmillaria tabescens]KAK0460139.1 hypothetical protein EV420DRAFT_1641469 [Desarmillaria tabescens]
MPLGVRPFRKTIPASRTKCPVCATIIVSSDDLYSITVNGVEIGSGNGWTHPAVYTVGLQPENDNVLAIAGNSTYRDAVPRSLLIIKMAPLKLHRYFDDAPWGNTVSILAGTSTPWGQPFVLPPVMSMTGTRQIWTNKTDANGYEPIEHRPLRKTITSLYGKAAVCGKVVVTADNAYTPYVNVVAVDGENQPPLSKAWVVASILIA